MTEQIIGACSPNPPLAGSFAHRGPAPTFARCLASTTPAASQITQATMRLSATLGLLQDLGLAFRFAFIPTFLAVLRNPTLLFRPHEVSRIFMSHVWKPFGDGIDQNSRPVKQSLIPDNARGVILDVGAGKCPCPILLNSMYDSQLVRHVWAEMYNWTHFVFH